MLERDRLLVVVPRKGAQVSGYNDTELHDIFEVRASLMTALYEAAARAHPESSSGNSLPALRTSRRPKGPARATTTPSRRSG